MFNIEAIVLHPGDTLLAHVSDRVSPDMARQIYQSLTQLFPSNQVSLINNELVEGFTVFTNEIDTNPFLINLEDLCQ